MKALNTLLSKSVENDAKGGFGMIKTGVMVGQVHHMALIKNKSCLALHPS